MGMWLSSLADTVRCWLDPSVQQQLQQLRQGVADVAKACDEMQAQITTGNKALAEESSRMDKQLDLQEATLEGLAAQCKAISSTLRQQGQGQATVERDLARQGRTLALLVAEEVRWAAGAVWRHAWDCEGWDLTAWQVQTPVTVHLHPTPGGTAAAVGALAGERLGSVAVTGARLQQTCSALCRGPRSNGGGPHGGSPQQQLDEVVRIAQQQLDSCPRALELARWECWTVTHYAQIKVLFAGAGVRDDA